MTSVYSIACVDRVAGMVTRPDVNTAGVIPRHASIISW